MKNTQHIRRGLLGLLCLTSLLCKGHGNDDTDRLLKLAKKDRNGLTPSCASNRDSLATVFIRKHEWEISQAEPEFSTIRKFPAKAGELEIASLNNGNSLPSLEYAYFLLWHKATAACATEIRVVPPSSNNTRYGIQDINLAPTPMSDVYQIQVTAQTETIDPTAVNPDATLRQRISKDVSFVRFSQEGDVTFLAAEIPIYDSGDALRKKTAPHELTFGLDSAGNLKIDSKTREPAKNQKPWIGQYRLTPSSGSTASPSHTSARQNNRDADYKAALALFKSGNPNAAADTLAKYFPSNALLSPSTLPIANDLGFFLVEAKRYSEGIKVLEAVLLADSNRTVAYLNLGDAYAGAGKTGEAKEQYRKYADRMTREGKAGKIPSRIKTLPAK